MTKRKSIPINQPAYDFSLAGIGIAKISVNDIQSLSLKGINQSHRDDYHLFFLQEKGTTTIEIDFKKHTVKPFSIIYIHPDQVHRTLEVKNATFSGWLINNENLKPEYLKLLDTITPVKPLLLNKEMFSIISEAVTLCIKFSERKHDKLHHSLLNDSCNILVGMVISQYLEQFKRIDKLSRFELIAKAFRTTLEHNFTTSKKPSAYAEVLNISTPYLNECVKNVTGYPVSYHIQERVILEAKRLLYYTDKSVKEIAAELGYDDYPYFSRLFSKVTGMTALNFRKKNHD
ncbi:MAG: AraC family transcriptional regulator [Chryseobacterium sp.]|jgi:AraC-like DNA-binding protein|nr:AraC family transcriptional regulator [Chryseobacterium sp.]